MSLSMIMFAVEQFKDNQRCHWTWKKNTPQQNTKE